MITELITCTIEDAVRISGISRSRNHMTKIS